MSKTPANLEMPSQASDLIAYLHEEGNSRRAEIQQRAEAEMAKIREDADHEKEQLLAEGRAGLAILEREIQSAEIGRAKWVSESEIQRAVGVAIDELMAGAVKRIEDYAKTPEFEKDLTKLILEAVHCARCFRPTAHAEGALGRIRVNPRNVELCRDIVSEESFPLEVEPDDDVIGGAVIDVLHSSYRVVNTLASRFEKKQAQLRSMVARRINEELARED